MEYSLFLELKRMNTMETQADQLLPILLESTTFQNQEAPLLKLILANAEPWSGQAGDHLCLAGQAQQGLYIYLNGDLEELADDGTSHPLLREPAAIIGTPSAKQNHVWPRTIRCSGGCRLLFLSQDTVRILAREHEKSLATIPAFQTLVGEQKRMHGVLSQQSSNFPLEPAVIQDLITLITLRNYTGGSLILQQGDTGDSLLIVVSGRLRASWVDGNGTRHLLSDHGPGSSLGEMGLILGIPRQVDVTAVRDSTVALLDRTAFSTLLVRHPISVNQAFSQVIFNHFSKPKQAKIDFSNVITLVPLQSDQSVETMAQGLADALGRFGTVKCLHNERQSDRLLHRDEIDTAFMELLAELEHHYDFLILQGEPEYTSWTRQCIRQADHLLFITHSADQAFALTNLEKQLAKEPWFDLLHKSLVLVHSPNLARPENTLLWLQNRSIKQHHHLRVGNAVDFQRLARFLTGRAVGVVLGGGGARGLAHIGILKAMKELSIPIDIVGGNSIGALIGAAYLLGFDSESILENIVQFATSGQRPGIPILSLISGVPMATRARKFFGQICIEDMWNPYFSVSCNLSQANLKTHMNGLLWKAVLASNSPAGLLPPIPDDGDLLVDAAVLDNVPVDVMRRDFSHALIVAIDVNIRDRLNVSKDVTQLTGWQVLKERFGRNKGGGHTPGIVDIITRTSIIGAVAQQPNARQMADLYLQPPVSGYPMFGFRQGAAIVECGYQYGMEQLPAWWTANCRI
ncbi:MAG: cyclic nucleotide-binding domain-containing protein [Magnetococcales bacterium]|nr:cyclic nucleotide-binding domain-containing protein [Magnetococcales bacterium]